MFSDDVGGKTGEMCAKTGSTSVSASLPGALPIFDLTLQCVLKFRGGAKIAVAGVTDRLSALS